MDKCDFDAGCDFGRIKDECVISLKVYDQCRQQDCLTPQILGSARSAERQTATVGGNTVLPGAVIELPVNASRVNIVENSFKISEIRIVSVEPRKFTCDGYWDVALQYVFTFCVEFYDTNNVRIPIIVGGLPQACLCATVTYDKLVPLFGSETSDIIIASNLFNPATNTLENKPYVLTEAQAMPLEVKLVPIACPCVSPAIAPTVEVQLTIGLFTIIKLFRLVNLIVKSKGFCRPKPCVNIANDPCDYFETLNFPYDIFNPPQKEDFSSCGNGNDGYCDDDCSWDFKQ